MQAVVGCRSRQARHRPLNQSKKETMKIHALTTGAVRVKHSFLFPSPGWRRQLDLFMPGAFSDPLPIHCWAIEHQGVLRLVDTGEMAAARDVPFARMQVTREQELPAAMARAGLKLEDVSEVVLTHAHGDHIDGLVHLRARALIHENRTAVGPIADGARDSSGPASAASTGLRARAFRAQRRTIRGVSPKPPAQRRRTHRGRRNARTHPRPRFGHLHRRLRAARTARR